MGDGEAAADFRESLQKGIKSKQRWVGQSKRSGESDGRTGVTSAASKRSVLSCRWGFMQQRSRKKRPIFYCPQGQYLGDELDGIWFPSACLLLLLPSLVWWENPAIFNLLYLYWGKFPSFFYLGLASQRAHLPVRTSIVALRIVSAATQHPIVRGELSSVLLPWQPRRASRWHLQCSERPAWNPGQVAQFRHELCVCAR